LVLIAPVTESGSASGQDGSVLNFRAAEGHDRHVVEYAAEPIRAGRHKGVNLIECRRVRLFPIIEEPKDCGFHGEKVVTNS
jgi:hypothetical protein